MFNRRFITGVIFIMSVALALAIYWDSREKSLTDKPDSSRFESGSGSVYKQYHELPESERSRIDYISSVLDSLGNERARLPYYGELVRTYIEAGNMFEAASWAEKRALQTEELSDRLIAGELYLEEAQNNSDPDIREKAAVKAKCMYQKALELQPGDASIRTDIAVIHMSMLQPDKAYKKLKQVLDDNPGHLRANFNMGVLLHQMGNTDESVPYFDRSLALAKNSEWENVVQGYLDRHHQDIYH